MHEPIKVICRLMDGRVNSADGLFALDSILYHAWFCKYDPEVLQGTKRGHDGLGADGKPIYIGLPLTKDDNGRYMASLGFYRQYGQSTEYWHKRQDMTTGFAANHLLGAGIVSNTMGPYKAYRMPQIIRLVSEIEFYAMGNAEKVEELLKYIVAIGKKPSAGWGLVREWEVQPWPEDWSTKGPYGIMRPMPVDQYQPSPGESYVIRDCAIKPPAWKFKNQTTCYVPQVILP